jgi:hypothetical protein
MRNQPRLLSAFRVFRTRGVRASAAAVASQATAEALSPTSIGRLCRGAVTIIPCVTNASCDCAQLDFDNWVSIPDLVPEKTYFAAAHKWILQRGLAQ